MKDKLIVGIVGFIVLVSILVGTKMEVTKELNKTPQEKFRDHYPLVSKDHSFQEKSEEEVIQFLEDGTGILVLGNPTDAKSSTYIGFVDESLKGKVSEIDYYQVESDFIDTEVYKKIKSLLGEDIEIEIPFLLVIKEGSFVGYDNQVVTEEEKDSFQEKLESMLSELNKEAN